MISEKKKATGGKDGYGDVNYEAKVKEIFCKVKVMEKGLAAGALADAAGRSILLRKCLLLCMAATNDYFH